MSRPRIAVIGAGISGLGAAWHLRQQAQVTVFEADGRFGGHANTVDLTLEGVTHGVDTGFLVYNERTYPQLIALFAELGVETAASDMSFSVQAPRAGGGRLEWSGSNLDSVFADRRNLLRPGFLGMLADILRFNRVCTALAREGDEAALAEPVGAFLQRLGFGTPFRDGYLLPMIGCIWSCPTEQMLAFPVATLIRFCHNHGLLQVADRPQWFTVKGGSRQYVERLLSHLPDCRRGMPVLSVDRGLRQGDPVTVHTAAGAETFDAVILACHSDQALGLLSQPTAAEQQVLGAIRYQPNTAVLHTDASLLPTRRKAWAAWNYERAADLPREQTAVCLHYLLNRLQPLPWQTPVIVSLNPVREPRPETVARRIDYAHPVFDQAAIAAQSQLPLIQGVGGLWYCGAWTGYGFHEDGLKSGRAVARALLDRHALLQGGTPPLAEPPMRRAA